MLQIPVIHKHRLPGVLDGQFTDDSVRLHTSMPMTRIADIHARYMYRGRSSTYFPASETSCKNKRRLYIQTVFISSHSEKYVTISGPLKRTHTYSLSQTQLRTQHCPIAQPSAYESPYKHTQQCHQTLPSQNQTHP